MAASGASPSLLLKGADERRGVMNPTENPETETAPRAQTTAIKNNLAALVSMSALVHTWKPAAHTGTRAHQSDLRDFISSNLRTLETLAPGP